ncbi:hypothetical protein KIPB_013114, partial [Kipferlia bialata]|eukprot:g13114.t1
MDLEDWYTACTEIPRVVPNDLTQISMAPLGDGRAMVVCREEDDAVNAYTDYASERWLILSLTSSGELERERIPGPPTPDGMVGIQLATLGDVVVAYGGGQFKYLEWGSGPCWFMAVYTIATGEWETIPPTKGPSIDMPHVFTSGDTLVVVGGYKKNGFAYGTWEWSVETRVWRHCGRCPVTVTSSDVGGLLGSAYHLLTDDRHLTFANKTWETAHKVEKRRVLLSAPLYGRHMLVVTCSHDFKILERGDIRCQIFDSVSQ